MNAPAVAPERMKRLTGFEHPEKVASSFVERLSETFDSLGKVVAAIAGAGVFFYLAGLFVMWQRLKKEGLPSEEGLSVLPRDQVAIAGVREVVLSLISAALLLFVLGFVLVHAARLFAKLQRNVASTPPTRAARSRSRRAFSWFAERIALWSLLILLTLLVFPLSRAGIAAALTLAGLFYYSVRLTQHCVKENQAFPLWRVGIAVLVAVVVLSVAREHDFPSQFTPVTAVMVHGKAFNGVYVGASADDILVGQRRIDLAGESVKGPRLLVLSRDSVKRLRLRRSSNILPKAKSLLGRFGLDLTCIPPECRLGNSRIGSYQSGG
jgi:hypothetical protein